jgi:hypothetical protein
VDGPGGRSPPKSRTAFCAFVIVLSNSTLPISFNSDAAAYGGANVGNLGATLQADGSGIELVVPPNGIVVLQRVS